MLGEAPAQHGDDGRGVVGGEGRLGGIGKPARVLDLDGLGRGHRLDQHHGAGRKLAHGPHHLGMMGMADEQDLMARGEMPLRLAMHLADQRAGRVEIEQLAARGLRRHRFGHAMGGEDDRRPVGHLVELVDEDGAPLLQPLDHIAVVDDLMADIDRRPIARQRLLDDLDRAIDAGAETAGRGQQDMERRRAGRLGVGSLILGRSRRHGAGLVRGRSVNYSPAAGQ
jgi:hypothetical protein